jgi:hypothetical protein
MNFPFFRDLALLTLRDPAEGGRRILAMNLAREVLWTALLLALVLNTLLLTAQNVMTPPGPEMPSLFTSPGLYFVMMAGGQILFIFGIYLAGGWLNGQGCLRDVMAVMVWLQLLQVVVQALVMVLLFVAAPLAMLLNFAAMLYGLYILLHFIDQAHRLNSLMRAAGVLAAALFAIAVALSLLIALVGGTLTGTTHV